MSTVFHSNARLVTEMRGVGIKSIEKTDTEGLVDTYTITYTDGKTTMFEVTNGADGISEPLVTNIRSNKFDKTYAEIAEAVSQGRQVFATITGGGEPNVPIEELTTTSVSFVFPGVWWRYILNKNGTVTKENVYETNTNGNGENAPKLSLLVSEIESLEGRIDTNYEILESEIAEKQDALTIDSYLTIESENPVQNKVISQQFDDVYEQLPIQIEYVRTYQHIRHVNDIIQALNKGRGVVVQNVYIGTGGADERKVAVDVTNWFTDGTKVIGKGINTLGKDFVLTGTAGTSGDTWTYQVLITPDYESELQEIRDRLDALEGGSNS